MFITPAYAQGLGGNLDSLLQSGIVPMVLVLVVMWFLMIRPQTQKAKELRKSLAALRRGDRIVTGGGIIGTIAKVVSDDELLVEIADGVRVRVMRSTVASVVAKTEPVAAKSDRDEADKGDDAEKGRGGRRAAGGN
jgi:preprotein translocase subunit YajC